MARKRQKTTRRSFSRSSSRSSSDSSFDRLSKRVYFQTGIGYEALDDENIGNSKNDPIHNLELGPLPAALKEKMELDLVFFSSTICRSVWQLGFGHFESIHRTARGSLILEKTTHKDKTNVLCGGLKIGNGCMGGLECFGVDLEFSFLEAAEENLKEMYMRVNEEENKEVDETATNIFAFKTECDDRKWLDASHFKMVNEDTGEEGVPDDLTTVLNLLRPETGVGKIQVLQERFPLRQCPDELRNCSVRPAEEVTLSPVSKETRIQQAEQQMAKFQNCTSDYWIHKHLGLPAPAAALVRSYLMPAPILYLEKGDYVISLDDQKYNGCFNVRQVFVFRPKSNK